MTGTVTDAANRHPVPDAVVTATSPTFQGEQVAVTDTTGTYRIPQLPPGIYRLRVEREGYKPYVRGDIDVRADRTLRLNVELLPEAIKEEIVVVGRAPTVDVGSSALGTTVTTDFVRNLALSAPTARGGASRSFESLALMAPTAQTDTYGISINGTTSVENGYFVDGLSVSNSGFGVLGSKVPIEFLDEVNVITGAYMPEFGRSIGGVFSAVTKSGSNEFHGAIYGTYTPGFAQGTGKQIRNLGGSLGSLSRLHNVGDLGATLGGPIIHDRLWFFAGIQPSAVRYKLEKDFYVNTVPDVPNPTMCVGLDGRLTSPSSGLCATTKIAGAEQFYFADQKVLNYIGKLTYLISQDHRVSLSVIGTPSTSGGKNSYPFAPAGGGPVLPTAGTFSSNSYKNDQGSTDVILKTASAFLEKHVLIDATVGYHHDYDSRLPADGSELGSSDGLAGMPLVSFRRTRPHPITDFETSQTLLDACGPNDTIRAVKCPVTAYSTGGPGFLNQRSFDIWQGRLVGTYFVNALGHHVLKAGFDGKYLLYKNLKGYSGGVSYLESSAGDAFTDNREYGVLVAPDQVQTYSTWSTKTNTYVVGGFLQDSWSIQDAVTLNIGIRYDTQIANGSDKKEALRLVNQWSPRIGVVYDFTQQGRSKLFANYARFYEDIPLDAFDRSFPGDRALSTGARQCDPRLPNCRPSPSIPITPNMGRTSVNQRWTAVGSDTVPVDPNLSAASADQIVIGAEYEVLPSARMSVSYTRQYTYRAIEDISNDEAQTYFLGNPGYGVAKAFPRAVRNYNAWTVSFNKTFSDLWLAQVNYTYATLEGNYQGLFLYGGQLDPNITSDFDLISLLPNRHDRLGPLPGDINHQIKVFGAKEFVITGSISLSAGLSYSMRSGRPIEVLGRHQVYGNGNVYILPRGSGGRLPWIQSVDPRLGFNYRLGKDSVLTLSVNAFNVFNFQRPITVDQNYTLQNVLPIPGGSRSDLPGNLRTNTGAPFDPAGVNPNYKNPIMYQPPRSIGFEARLTF